MNTLPVIYLANHNARMTSVLFQEWITAWDAALAKDRRKILLLVDNYTAHPHIDMLKNIWLEFLPANTTSLIQPMDQGVIKNLKTFYRKELVQMTVAAIDDNLASSSSTATDIRRVLGRSLSRCPVPHQDGVNFLIPVRLRIIEHFC